MTSGEVVPSSRISSCSSHSLIVIPSTKLDSNLHDRAAQITKQRCSQQEASLDGSHDDDLMTPPTVLLKKALAQAKQLLSNVGVVSDQEGGVAGGVSEGIGCCIRCTALARIVYGDAHWMLARTHIQLAQAYLQLKDLPQQALHHAIKGRDILGVLPGPQEGSHDPQVSSHDSSAAVAAAWNQLTLAHCIAGQAYTAQGILPKAAQEFTKARKAFSRTKQLLVAGSDGEVGSEEDLASLDELETERTLQAALARFHLKQENFELSRDYFGKAVELMKAVFGPTSSRLLPLLRGLATAEARLSLYESAEQTLQEALEIAEASYGKECKVVAQILQAQGRLGAVRLKADGQSVNLGGVEDKFSKAAALYTSLKLSQDCLKCKEEWSLMLAAGKEQREKAISMLKELLADKKDVYGEFGIETGQSLKLLASLLLSEGRVKEAIRYLQKAESVYHISLGASHKDTLSITKSLQSITGAPGSSQKITKPLFKTVV